MTRDNIFDRLERASTIQPPTRHRLEPVTSIWDIQEMAKGDMMGPAKKVVGTDDVDEMAEAGWELGVDDDDKLVDDVEEFL